jgi:hypothetical protein
MRRLGQAKRRPNTFRALRFRIAGVGSSLTLDATYGIHEARR